MFLLEAPGRVHFRFQLLEATRASQFVTLSSIFRASNSGWVLSRPPLLLPRPVFRVRLPQRLPAHCLGRPASRVACSQTVAHSTGEPGTAGRWGTRQAQSQGPAGDSDLARDLCGICTIKHFYSMSWSRSREQLLLCR